MKRKPISSPVLTPADLAGQGQRFMDQGRWRDAVESFKQLAKQEPNGNWHPLLATAYEKRAEELTHKKMFKEALILLNNADALVTDHQTITGKNKLLRLTCLGAVGQPDNLLAFYLREETSLQTAWPHQFPLWQEHMAALLLTNPIPQTLPADSPWRIWSQAAREAIAAFCRGDQTGLESLLGRISLRSPYKPLRSILLALLLIRTQPDKARHLADSIPAPSPWSGMARLVSLCLMEKAELLQQIGSVPPHELEWVARWRGITPASWRKATELLSLSPAKLLPALLDKSSDWSIPDASLRRPAFLLLITTPAAQTAFERRFGPLEATERSRLSALRQENAPLPKRLQAWRSHLNVLQAASDTPERNWHLAMTHRHMAALILDENPHDSDAVIHFEKSLEFDPDHRPTHQTLLEWYKNRHDDLKARRVVERALQLFPNDAFFLYAAVQEALKGKTFKKASRLAKRLLTIDPLHAGVRRDLVAACLSHARKQVSGGRVDLAHKELAEAASWERDEDKDGKVSINKAFLEWLSSREQEGNTLLAQGIQEAGGGLSAHLRAAMEGSRMGLPTGYMARLMNALSITTKGQVTRESMMILVRTAMEYSQEKLLGKLLMDIGGFFTSALNLNFQVEEMRSICQLLALARCHGPLARYAAVGEKKWRDQSVFVYYRLLAKYKGPKENISYADRNRLIRVMDEALDRHDHELVQALRDWIYDEEDEDDDDFMDSFPFPFPNPLGDRNKASSQDKEEMLFNLLFMIANMIIAEYGLPSSRDIFKLGLKEFLKDQAPPEVVRLFRDSDAIVEKVVDKFFPSTPSPGRIPFDKPEVKPMPPPSRRGRRPAANPNQMNLDLDLDQS
ncbi:MAG: hypothetical protein H7839_19375 [Magnetococcus sp. YQC-5]